jgi:glycosyltransferase involved in cell wall biosynthesis
MRFLGFADDADLPGLMSLATVFAFPSLSEGFGFPALEAMRCGTCLLAANAGSLPEIVQDGGLLVDPLDVGAIAAGLRTLLGDAELRRRLATRGMRRAAAYTWERTADLTVQTYREVVAATLPASMAGIGL